MLILGSGGSSAAIIQGRANWLGKIWADRLLEKQKATHASELEFLARRRDIYAKLAINMRVFLTPHEINKTDRRNEFLEAYDEAYLWSSQNVIEELGNFIDLIKKNTSNPGSVSEIDKQQAYASCLHALRIDAGHKDSNICYRVISF